MVLAGTLADGSGLVLCVLVCMRWGLRGGVWLGVHVVRLGWDGGGVLPAREEGDDIRVQSDVGGGVETRNVVCKGHTQVVSLGTVRRMKMKVRV